MQKIEKKIEDAIFLWNNDRRESALIIAMVCIASLSRKRYPLEKDGEAFKKMFRDFRGHINIQVEYRGKLEPIETIFYKWIRCQLIHEAEMPFDIELIEDTKFGKMSIRAGGRPTFILQIGTGWFFHIIDSLLDSQEVKTGV
jgi:hypothetical protein